MIVYPVCLWSLCINRLCLLCHPVAVPVSLVDRSTDFPSYSSLGLIPSSLAEPIFYHHRFGLFVAMPRRPAPTPLVLYQGPLPPRNHSKFTMPTMPRPIFLPVSVVTRAGERAVGDNRELGYGIKGGSGKMRGPWDHSGTYRTVGNTAVVVAPPKACCR
jgi:hypothetical protein